MQTGVTGDNILSLWKFCVGCPAAGVTRKYQGTLDFSVSNFLPGQTSLRTTGLVVVNESVLIDESAKPMECRQPSIGIMQTLNI